MGMKAALNSEDIQVPTTRISNIAHAVKAKTAIETQELLCVIYCISTVSNMNE